MKPMPRSAAQRPRRAWLLLLPVAVALLLPATSSAGRRGRHRPSPETLSGRVRAVSDGDTVVVDLDSGSIRVRVAEVDAPELHQEYGQQSRSHTASLVLGRPVTLEVRDHDRYDRTVARVRLPDGRDLSEELVRAGLGWWYRAHSNDGTLRRLEGEARAAHRGLWADPDPIPPWVYRRTQPMFQGARPSRR